MTEEDVRTRFWQFGGVPRHVFAVETDDLIKAQNSAINTLSPEQAKRVALGEMTPVEEFGKTTESALLAFRLSGDDSGRFKNGEPYIVSARVSEEIVFKFKSDLWNVMLSRGPNDGKGMIFERITRLMIANGNPSRRFEGRRCVGIRHPDYNKRIWLTLGTEDMEMRQVIDPMNSAISSTMMANIVFHPISPTNILYDFLYKDSSGHFHVFQATVGGKNSANADAIQELEVKARGASNLSFYFLVPASTFPSFVTNPVEPKRKPEGSFKNIFHVSIPNPEDQRSGATEGALRQL